ncbi:MAG: hypothetical protein OSJ27_00100 [Candidatus Gastranaerophilales bacterium]|nr:hypothetical protein [Candidatus Gastranaerophilales bacterium]
MTTNDDLIAKLSKERQEKIQAEAEKEITKWGGKRKGAGRKPKTDNVLEFRIRVSKKEKEFIDYARSHSVNFDDLMQG